MLSYSGSIHDNVYRGFIIRMQDLIHGGIGICGSFIAEEPNLNLALAERRVNDQLLALGYGSYRNKWGASVVPWLPKIAD